MALSTRIRLGAVAASAGACAIYLTGLTTLGLVGPDEPRYAAIGQAMARSGDWVTPTLWGHAWFEKPVWLYWMTGAAFRAGFGPELAPRLPVALLSLLFLAFLWWRLRGEFGARAAWAATLLCGTSAGWLAYSHVAVTDLPMSAFFNMAVMLSLPWLRGKGSGELWLPAICLALAALSKALVPLVLFTPVLAAGALDGGWRRLADWFRPAPLAGFALVALPWYVLCTLRNGYEFVRVLFVEQHFQRIRSAGLQHVQPWWFYLPVLLLLLFPWFPLLGALPAALRPQWKDPRVKALAGVAAFGLFFFSVAVNKLPGYLLPLLPALCTLIGLALTGGEIKTPQSRPWLIGVAGMIGLFPAIGVVAPVALARGLRAAAIPWALALAGMLLGALAGAALTARFRAGSLAILAVAAGTGYFWFETFDFPALDQAASARSVWVESRPACTAPTISRNLLYGLYYYSEKQLPPCASLDPDTTRVVR